jgi:16S rRNA U516 pseudouridylate synthase RsuA-like enzyme
VEQLIRSGRVSVNGETALVTTRVTAGDDVRVDGAALASTTGGGVIWHRPRGAPLTIVHPGQLHAVCPLGRDQSGLELLLADAALARRLADPRFPILERFAPGGIRIRLAAVRVGRLAPGEWRPVSAREHAQLRRGVRLPPRED